MKVDMARINEIIQEVTSTEKVAHAEERIAIDELISELEKVAGEADAARAESNAITGDGITLESEDFAKQRLKETLLEGIKSDEPSPVCQELKDSLLAGDTQRAREILEKVASRLQERMRTPQRKIGGGSGHMEKKAVELLQKSASALRQMQEDLKQEAEKRASAEQKLETYEKNQERLFKLASREAIRYEDVPEMLETLNEMEPRQQELELLSLEKAASMNFLRVGSIEKTSSDHGAEDVLTRFILDSMG